MSNGRVVVLGAGSTGEAFIAAFRRAGDDRPLTVVEKHLAGGECSYYACMPSKTLLRSTELVHAARLAPGAAEAITGEPDAERIFWWRDQVTGNWDDSSQEKWLADHDAELVRGEGRVVAPGRLAIDGEEIEYEELVLATGSHPRIPDVPGLADVPYWTNRAATSSHEVPDRLVVLGGGAVGCEMAQFYRRIGAEVTLVQRSGRLLPRTDAAAGALLLDAFREDGIDVRLDAAVTGVEPGIRVSLGDGSSLEASHVLIAAGRLPAVDDLGLESLELTISDHGIEVDDHLKAGEHVWAIGDLTGVAMFTHVGKYQGRVAAVNVAGGDARADYRAIPASVFTDPQVASVGTTEGEGLVTAEWKLTSVARSSTFERPKQPGLLKVAADPKRRVLVGATGVGPESGEWLQQLTLAIRAEIPVDVLLDTIQPYPTFSEVVFYAVRELGL